MKLIIKIVKKNKFFWAFFIFEEKTERISTTTNSKKVQKHEMVAGQVSFEEK